MTADPRDITIEGRLALIADNLETRIGSDPGARRRDWTIPAILKRINDSISGGAFEAHLLGEHTDVDLNSLVANDILIYDGDDWLNLPFIHSGLAGLSADDHPHYLLADGSRDVTGDMNMIGTLSVTKTVDDDLSEGWNGSLIETPAITVTATGGVITFSVEQSGGGNLTTRFGGQSFTFVSTPAATIVLAVGTDTVPVESWVWLAESGGTVTLVTGTAGFPSTSFCPLATVICQSAASLETDGAFQVHAWTDHISSTTENGHLHHINAKLRKLHANWVSGLEAGNMTTSDPDAYLSCAAGVVAQMHNHPFPARDMASSDPAWVVNNSGTAYLRITSLDAINTDAVGGAINNKYINLVLWGSVNQSEANCKIFINVSSGTYVTAAAAITDAQNYAVYAIPAEFVGTGFLIARYVVQAKSSGLWVQSDKIDLRGQFPADIAGGTGTGAVQLDDLSDVTLSGPAVTEVLRHDGTDWKNAAIALGDLPAIALSDLSNVTGTPSTNSVLIFSTGQWRGNIGTYISKINQLTDVSIDGGGASHRDFLVYNSGSSEWENFPKEQIIWAQGDIPLTADWDAGDFEILMEQIDVSWAKDNTVENPVTFAMTANDTADHSKDLIFIDVNYDFDNSGAVCLAEIAAINIDMDMTLTAAIAAVPKFRLFKADLNYGGHNPLDAAFEVTVTGTGATALFGGSMAHFRWNNSAVSGVALKAEVYGSSASAAASNIIVGITGFADGADSYTGMIIGFRGVCDNTNSASGAIAVHGRPAATVTTLAKDKMVALGGFEGHLFLNGGSGAFIDTTAGSFDTPNVISPTHLDFVNNTGELYVENNVEIDGILYLDGDLDHNGANIGFFGTAPVAQAAAYTPTNVTPDRSYDANSTTLAEIADVLGTLIADLQAYGLLQ